MQSSVASKLFLFSRRSYICRIPVVPLPAILSFKDTSSPKDVKDSPKRKAKRDSKDGDSEKAKRRKLRKEAKAAAAEEMNAPQLTPDGKAPIRSLPPLESVDAY
jgi:hypothetical protein